MPTSLPRLSVVITDEQDRLLTRLSALQERSKGSYVRKLLDLATPSLRAILGPLERAEEEEQAYDTDMEDILREQLREADDELAEQLTFLEPQEVADAAVSAPARSVQATEDDDAAASLPRAANA